MVLFAGVASLAAIDLASDLGAGTSTAHLLIEGILLAVGLIGVAIMARTLMQFRSKATLRGAETTAPSDQLGDKADGLDALDDRQQRAAAEADQWRHEAKELMRGLGVAIDRQFDAWALTDAEKALALWMVRGLSHDEIADVLNTNNVSIRKQASSVYKKAGITSRNQLSAFFLDDLSLPVQAPNSDRPN